MEKWLNSAWEAICNFPPGETFSGSQIIDRLRGVTGEPDHGAWWSVALMDAEMSEKLIFDGKFAQDGDLLPVNPIYKIPGTPVLDFWEAIKERTA